jgi:hypothetical protein
MREQAPAEDGRRRAALGDGRLVTHVDRSADASRNCITARAASHDLLVDEIARLEGGERRRSGS